MRIRGGREGGREGLFLYSICSSRSTSRFRMSVRKNKKKKKKKRGNNGEKEITFCLM